MRFRCLEQEQKGMTLECIRNCVLDTLAAANREAVDEGNKAVVREPVVDLLGCAETVLALVADEDAPLTVLNAELLEQESNQALRPLGIVPGKAIDGR